MADLKDWLSIANLLLVPLLIYLRGIDRSLTRLLVLVGEHEKADKEKFGELFKFKGDIDRRGRDELLGRGGS